MADLWTDLRLAFTLIFFVYLVKWGADLTKSKALGVLLAAVVGYLTFYSHPELVIVILVFFFGYPFFEKFGEAFGGGKKD